MTTPLGYLVNAVTINTKSGALALKVGDPITDSVTAAAVAAAGGQLASATDPNIQATIATILKMRGRGQNEELIGVIMMGAFVGSGTVEVTGTTKDATASGAIDTGYAPPAGKGAKLDINYVITDVGNQVSRSGNGEHHIKNFGGTVSVVGTAIYGGSVGDAALAPVGATGHPVLSVAGGTLQVTLTPPTGYSGTISWKVDVSFVENP